MTVETYPARTGRQYRGWRYGKDSRENKKKETELCGEERCSDWASDHL